MRRLMVNTTQTKTSMALRMTKRTAKNTTIKINNLLRSIANSRLKKKKNPVENHTKITMLMVSIAD